MATSHRLIVFSLYFCQHAHKGIIVSIAAVGCLVLFSTSPCQPLTVACLLFSVLFLTKPKQQHHTCCKFTFQKFFFSVLFVNPDGQFP